MRLHMPLIRADGVAFVTFLALVFVHIGWVTRTGLGGIFPEMPRAWLYVLGAMLYTHCYEYFWHRGPMHHATQIRLWGLSWLLSWLAEILTKLFISHTEHHKDLCDEHVQTRDPARLTHIATHPKVFPVLLPLHYVLVLWCFPAPAATWILAGITWQFMFYETNHWLTHVKDNGVDRFIEKAPERIAYVRSQLARVTEIDPALFLVLFVPYVLFWFVHVLLLAIRWLRGHQIEFHIAHHDRVEGNYGFSVPPPLWDSLCGTRLPRR